MSHLMKKLHDIGWELHLWNVNYVKNVNYNTLLQFSISTIVILTKYSIKISLCVTKDVGIFSTFLARRQTRY